MIVGTAMSDRRPIYFGVPQGSVLGPALFCMYAMPLEDIIYHYGLQYIVHADDIQLYITCDNDHVPTGTIEQCVGEIRNWMKTNMVALIDRKTEVIHFSDKFYPHSPVPSCDHHDGGVSISPNATFNLASVEHHGVQPTGCMDNEPEPSRGVPCLAFPGRPTNSGTTLPRTAHLDGGVIGNHQFITSHLKCTPASPDIRPTTWLCPACLPSTNSIPAPIQPTIAMTTTHIHQL